MEYAPRFVGASVRRVEDHRLLTGHGRYVDEIRLPGTLHVAFARSPHAHARILGVDVARAVALPGVAAALTGEEARALARPLRARYTRPDFHETDYPLLAVDKVRFAGEPIAAVVAGDRYRAEDAAELVETAYDPLPPVLGAEAAMAPGAAILHEGVGSNVLFRGTFEAGDVAAAFRDAEVIVRETFYHRRQTGAPLEGRGCLAQYDASVGMLTLWTSTQIPHIVRTALAASIGLPEHRVRVVAPDVGGGFGIKANLFPEEVVVCLLARRLERPVRWTEDRREHLVASIHAREQTHTVELVAKKDGTLLAVRDRILSDAGAYSAYPWGAAQEALGAMRNVPGPYKVAAYACEAVAAATNKCPLGPYRGVARPVTTFVMERMMDRLARELGLDPADVRRRNMVRPHEFPYTSVTGFTFDSGSHTESLEQALALVDYQGWRGRQAEGRRAGRYVGVGIASYVESAASGSAEYNRRGIVGIGGFERAIVTMDPSGKVTLRVGIASQGQGLETTLAQVVADELGVGVEDVRVIQGDTDLCPYGMGAFASRCAVAAGSSAMLAARVVREKMIAIASHLMETNADDLVVSGGRAFVRGSPSRGVTIQEIAELAHFWPTRLPRGTPGGLEATAQYDPPAPTFSNATHVAVVEVEGDTGQVRVLRYVAVEDCGRILNPAVVDGQVQGGVAQGIGGGLYEELPYDDAGAPLATTFMDYLLPTACEVPPIEVSHLESLSPVTPGGQKGMGEGGTIGAHAAIANAVADALSPFGARVTELPLTPERVLRLMTGSHGTPGATP